MNIPTNQITILNHSTPPPISISDISPETIRTLIAESERGVTERLFSYYCDIILTHSHVQAELSKRKLAVLGDPLSIQPWDKKIPADKLAADETERLLENTTRFFTPLAHLLDSVLVPVAVCEKVFAPDGPRRYRLNRLIPVQHHLIDYKSGHLQIRDTDQDGRLIKTAHDPDPARYIVHRGHLLSAPDQRGGPIRSIIWWILLSIMDRTWWSRFLDRYGSPFLLGRVASGKDDDRYVLERAFSLAQKLGGLVVNEGTTVEIKETLRAEGRGFENFHNVCNREISKLILGQTLSSEAQPA